MKKIAFLISAYTEPESLKRLISALSNMPADFYVHIDKKVDIGPFKEGLSDRKNVFFLPEERRVKIYWGGV